MHSVSPLSEPQGKRQIRPSMICSTPEILNQYFMDSEGPNCPSFHRILIERKHFKYIRIEAGVYDLDDLYFPVILEKKLPLFPRGDWNIGIITLESGRPRLSATSQAALPSSEYTWHEPPPRFEYLSFKFERRLKSHVQIVTSPHFQQPVIAKFARFYWEVGHIAEIEAHSWIHGHELGPKFLGYLTEEERVMGFLTENLVGRRVNSDDLEACRETVRRMHALGIIHNDLKKNKFLIRDGKAVIVDFEHAEKSTDEVAMRKELASVEEMLSP